MTLLTSTRVEEETRRPRTGRLALTLTVAVALLAGTTAPLATAAPAASLANGVIGWGDNYGGPISVPPGLTDVTDIEGGSSHSIALRGDGTVAAWGDNVFGQTAVPPGLTGITAIAAGNYDGFAVRSNGTVASWGSFGFENGATVPSGLNNVTAVAAGFAFAIALRSNGTVTGWGDSYYGQATVPPGLAGVTAIAAGDAHSLALRSNGTVVAWGRNNNGQATVPAGLTGVVAIAAGSSHSLALRSNGTVVAWGSNDRGQTVVPPGLTDVTAIAAGAQHSLALHRDGTVTAWGSTAYGETRVPAGLTTVTNIAGGGYFSLAAGPRPVFTADAPPTTANVDTAYSYTFTAQDAASFTVESGRLPYGLALSSSGVLSGTPTTTGTSTFTVTATNLFGTTTSASHTITVDPAPDIAPAISGIAPDGTAGTGYDYSYTATGTPTPAVTVLSGTLPPGLTLNTEGRLTGTPTTPGTYTFTLQATNTASTAQTTDTITIDPAAAAPAISGTAPDGTAGTGYDYSYTLAGTPTPETTLLSGTLPPGLTLNSTGRLTGTPTTAGTYTFTVQATNTAGTAQTTDTITIDPAAVAPTISGTAPDGTVGIGYDYSYSLAGTPTPHLTGLLGTVPAGLTLDSTGRLIGTPTTPGTYTFTVQATNTAGTAQTTDTITIDPAAVAPSISGDAPDGTAGTGYDYSYTATGTPTPAVTVLSGTLPPGLTLSTEGRLTGTPTTAGTYAFTVQAATTAGTAQTTDTITIDPAAVAPTISGVVAAGMVGSVYDYSYTVTGSPAPTVTLPSGTLPPGLTLSTAGRLTGTPTTAGTYTFSVQAANSAGTAQATSTLTISPQKVTTKADLRVDLSAPSTAVKGKTYVYTATTKNAGPAASSTVYTKVILPPNTQFVSATGKYTRVGNLVIFQRSTLTNGQTVVEKITVKATSTGKGTGLASTFSTRTPDPTIGNNADTVTTTTR